MEPNDIALDLSTHVSACESSSQWVSVSSDAKDVDVCRWFFVWAHGFHFMSVDCGPKMSGFCTNIFTFNVSFINVDSTDLVRITRRVCRACDDASRLAGRKVVACSCLGGRRTPTGSAKACAKKFQPCEINKNDTTDQSECACCDTDIGMGNGARETGVNSNNSSRSQSFECDWTVHLFSFCQIMDQLFHNVSARLPDLIFWAFCSATNHSCTQDSVTICTMQNAWLLTKGWGNLLVPMLTFWVTIFCTTVPSIVELHALRTIDLSTQELDSLVPFLLCIHPGTQCKRSSFDQNNTGDCTRTNWVWQTDWIQWQPCNSFSSDCTSVRMSDTEPRTVASSPKWKKWASPCPEFEMVLLQQLLQLFGHLG